LFLTFGTSSGFGRGLGFGFIFSLFSSRWCGGGGLVFLFGRFVFLLACSRLLLFFLLSGDFFNNWSSSSSCSFSLFLSSLASFFNILLSSGILLVLQSIGLNFISLVSVDSFNQNLFISVKVTLGSEVEFVVLVFIDFLGGSIFSE